MPDYPKFFAFLDEYITHYKTFLEFEYSKLDLINKGEIEKLSNSLSKEQSLIMKSNAFETKRLKILGDDAGKTFDELIASAPKWYQHRLTVKHEELSEVVRKIKEINDTANVIITERLHKIEKKFGELDTYNNNGTVSHEKVSRTTMTKSV